MDNGKEPSLVEAYGDCGGSSFWNGSINVPTYLCCELQNNMYPAMLPRIKSIKLLEDL